MMVKAVDQELAGSDMTCALGMYYHASARSRVQRTYVLAGGDEAFALPV